MITALYSWAKYKAEEENLSIRPDEFNSAMENLITAKIKDEELYILYDPIKHLYEVDPSANPNYKFKIKDKYSEERDPCVTDMKYLMVPKRDLSSKAKQSIGGSIFGRWMKKYKDEKGQIVIKEDLKKFWRKRLLNTYFQSGEKYITEEENICSFCGIFHRFKSLRFNPPVNIFVEDVTNYNSYLSNEPSHSICPYCAMLFLRTVIAGKGPEKIPFPQAKNAFIYTLPYDPENKIIYEVFEKKKAEKFLEKEFELMGRKSLEKVDALNYLLCLPLIVFESRAISLSGKLKPSLYIIFASKGGQVEEVSNHFVVTRFDYLAKVGEILHREGRIKPVLDFKERLSCFVEKFKGEQKTTGFKIIFRFFGKMLSNGEIDFTFLHSLLRKEITQKKEVRLSGYKYINAFLKAKKRRCKMAKILISTDIEKIVDTGRRFGSEWAKLREHERKKGQERVKWFDNMVLKLDSPTADGFHKILRKMIRNFYNNKEKEFKWNISSEVLSILSDKSRSYWRHAFMTGVFFGYYGYYEQTGKKEEENEQ